jgi:hypoxanthine phosphoribosyltransferase
MKEYARSLKINLCFQGFDQELAELPGRYAAPTGGLWLALMKRRPVGCAALRKLNDDVCEMKRLYVRPAARGQGLGRRLAVTAIQAARQRRYKQMRLDTLGSMKEAISLYEGLGFRPIASYYSNPSPGAVFMELALNSSGRCSRGLAVPLRREAAAVPASWRGEVAHVLITQKQIARRIAALAREITRDFAESELVVVAVLNGTVMFLADLLRHIALPLRLDFIGVSSYGLGTRPGELVFTKELRLDVRGRDVLLVDDILDTGRTLVRLAAILRALGPRRVKTCVLLNKTGCQTEAVKADYVGFHIPNAFVVGYGLDFAERYRNLPFVGVLHSQVYQHLASESGAPNFSRAGSLAISPALQAPGS